MINIFEPHTFQGSKALTVDNKDEKNRVVILNGTHAPPIVSHPSLSHVQHASFYSK